MTAQQVTDLVTTLQNEAKCGLDASFKSTRGLVVRVKWRPLDRYSYWLEDVDYSLRQFEKLLILLSTEDYIYVCQ